MADERIEIEIVLEDGTVVKGFQRINDEAEKSAKDIEKSFSRSFGSRLTRDISRPFDVLKNSVFNLRTAVVGIVGLVGGGAFLATVTRAAAQQQEAVNALNSSLQTAGTFSQEASRSFQDLASELQQNSIVGDEVILQQAALARNFTRTNEEAEKLTRAAIELSAATGQSLESAVTNLGKSFSGLAGELGESIPALRNLTQEQLKAGGALDLVLNRFGGAALAQTRTFNGALTQLSNTFGDFLEGLGQGIADSPVVINLFNALSQTINTISQSLTNGSINLDSFLKSAVINTAAAANAIIESFAALAQIPQFIQFTFTQVQIAVLKGINLILSGIQPLTALLERVIGGVGDGANVIVANFQKISELEGSLGAIAAEGVEIDKSFDFARRTLDEFTTSFQTLSTQSVVQGPTESPARKIVESVDKDLVELRKKVAELQISTREAINNTFFNAETVLAGTPSVFENLEGKGTKALTALQLKLQETRDKTVQLSQQIGQAVNVGIANTIANGISSVVRALAAGDNAFEAFAKALLSTVGNLAIQLGTTLILSGIGVESLKVLGGAAAIAAGAGLVAIGALLSAASAGASPNAGGGSAVTPPLADLNPGGISNDLEDQGARVQVNIQGSVFDGQETGLRIADILKEEGFNGARVS